MKNRDIKTTTVSSLVYKGQPKIVLALFSATIVSAKHRVAAALFPDSQDAPCFEIDAPAYDIEALFSGEEVRLSLAIVRMDLCSDFKEYMPNTGSLVRLLSAPISILQCMWVYQRSSRSV